MLRVVIDGRPCEFSPGTSVLQALQQAGVRIPTLCHDERLAPTGTCRSCLVRVAGVGRLLTACATPLHDGMVIAAHTPELEEYRRSLLRLWAWRYPAAAVAGSPQKEFHRWLREYGLESELRGGGVQLADRSHPYIAVDPSRCIACYRCVRICHEVQGQDVWHVRGRGIDTQIVPDGPTLRDSPCVSCGACADTCPTGALDDAEASRHHAPSQWTRTTCPYCGTGCELSVGSRDGRIVSIRGIADAPVSKGHLCVKGRYGFGFVDAGDRMTEPMIRKNGAWTRVSWSVARGVVASRLRGLIDRHGPDSIGLLGSARAPNEDAFVAQKFARLVLGTNNVDCCARVCHAPSAAGLKAVLGAGLATNSFDDIEAARTLLLCGANATEGHPVIGARIRQAARRGANLIVIDPRRIELTADACHLPITPGTNVPLLNAMAHTIVAEELGDREFMERRVAGVEDFTRFIQAWPPERAARICGVDAGLIRDAARIYAAGPPAMTLHGLGLTEHVQGTEGVMALINLALLTGNLGRPGGGVNPLRGQNNVQGAAHMGCDPTSLPGSTPIDTGRVPFERYWGGPLPHARGLNLLEMMDAARDGRLKGLWTIGYDLLLTNPNATETARALRSLEFVIVQDLFLTETAREFGSVFLPACSSFERDGTFMNAERRIQRVRAAIRPLGGAKPDWQIVSEIARTMGHQGFGFRNPEEIWDEVRALCPGAHGMSYARLDAAGLQWPCPTEDHPGTKILHVGTFEGGRRASLQCVEYRASPVLTTERYPLLLITGRSLYQFNAGTMTTRTRNVELRPSDRLDIARVDAMAAGVHDGDRVRVISAYGSAILPAHISETVREGQPFATFHSKELFLNAVTGPNRDNVTSTPEYKVTAVRIEPAAAFGREIHHAFP